MKGIDDPAVLQGPENSGEDERLCKGGGGERKFHDQIFAIAIKSCLAELFRLVPRRFDRSVLVVGKKIVKRFLGRYTERKQQEQSSRNQTSYGRWMGQSIFLFKQILLQGCEYRLAAPTFKI
jgi:hypothetical protein